MEVDERFIIRSIKSLMEKCGFDIDKIKNPTEEIQEVAIRATSGAAIKNIQNPTIAIQRLAIKYNGINIRYIKNPTPELISEAILQNGLAIEFVSNPSIPDMIRAVRNNWSALGKIKNPPDNIILEAISANARAFQFVNKSLPEAELLAYSKSKGNIQYIKNPSREIQEDFINHIMKNPYATFDSGYYHHVYPINDMGLYCPNIDIDLARKVYEKHRTTFDRHLSKCSEDIQLMRLERSPSSIRFIENPSLAVQKKAISLSTTAFHYIDKPHTDVISENLELIRNRQQAVKCYHLIKDDSAKVYLKMKFGLDRLRKRKTA